MRKAKLQKIMLPSAYLAALLRLTVFRNGAFTHAWCRGALNLTPGTAYGSLVSWGSYGPAARLFFGNILIFVPWGFALAKRGRGFWACALWGLALSLAIEVGQFVLGTGIAETDDLLLNALGAMAGYGLFILYKRMRTHAKND